MAINLKNWSSRGSLSIPLDSETQSLKLKFSEGALFALPEADYCYATLRSHGKFEHVRVLDSSSDTLTVVRGVDNTSPQFWPAGTCVSVEWNPLQLCEYSAACVLGTTPTTVDAGVYCLDCDTCITIGDDGRIVAIDGSKSC